MTKLYMTRHGQTQWNKVGRMQGQLNSDLTDLGIEQALKLGERLENTEIDIIISSTSQRALDTAALIKGIRDIQCIEIDDLKEMHFGSWQGMLSKDVKTKYPEAYDDLWNQPHKYKPIEGESFQALNERVIKAIEFILKKYKDKNILVVAHGIVLRALLTYFDNKPLDKFWEGPYMASTCLNLSL